MAGGSAAWPLPATNYHFNRNSTIVFQRFLFEPWPSRLVSRTLSFSWVQSGDIDDNQGGGKVSLPNLNHKANFPRRDSIPAGDLLGTGKSLLSGVDKVFALFLSNNRMEAIPPGCGIRVRQVNIRQEHKSFPIRSPVEVIPNMNILRFMYFQRTLGGLAIRQTQAALRHRHDQCPIPRRRGIPDICFPADGQPEIARRILTVLNGSQADHGIGFFLALTVAGQRSISSRRRLGGVDPGNRRSGDEPGHPGVWDLDMGGCRLGNLRFCVG
jgi:hypothetical protein